MAERINASLLPLLSTIFLLTCCHISAAKPGDLTIELIHRHSPESPFYQPNLTHYQKIQNLAHQSKARAQYLQNMKALALKNQTYGPQTARMIWSSVQSFALYSVRVGLGTTPTNPPFYAYNLLADTGSDLTWVQCEGCKYHVCFPSHDVPFPSSSSTTYKPLPCNAHPLCEKDCLLGNCVFERTYGDGSNLLGIIASETFRFHSSTDPAAVESVPNLVFGCAEYNNKISFGTLPINKLSGLLGLGFGPKSFVPQLDAAGQGNGRFTYCLRRGEEYMAPTNSFIQFGADIPQRAGLSVTALRRYGNLGHYYVNLLGISINGRRLDIPEAAFASTPDGSRGTIIDSGASFSIFVRPAYDVLAKALADMFDSLGANIVKKIRLTDLPFLELCYEIVDWKRFPGFPRISLHFQNNADMNLDPEAAFVIWAGAAINPEFCLGMVPENDPHGISNIAAFQQTNYRFIYDTKLFTLSFAPENCRQSP